MKELKAKWKEGKCLSAWLTALVLCLSAVAISVICVAIQPGSFLGTIKVFCSDPLLFALNGFPVCVVLLLFWAII